MSTFLRYMSVVLALGAVVMGIGTFVRGTPPEAGMILAILAVGIGTLSHRGAKRRQVDR